MDTPPNKTALKITYLRQCYQADNRALVITDFMGKKVEKSVWLKGEEQVLTGFYPHYPLPEEYPEEVVKSLLVNQQEYTLIQGALFLTGRLEEDVARTKQLMAPLIIYPTELFSEGETVQYRVLFQRRQLNQYVVRALLPDDKELTTKLDALERLVPRGPLDFGAVGEISRWFQEHLPDIQVEEALFYPNRLDEAAMKKLRRSRSQDLKLVSAGGMGIITRSRDTLGILSETETLSQLDADTLSAPLRQLLGEGFPSVPEAAEQPLEIPGSLNDSQKKALHNARHYLLSIIQGPPGTGKSYTIANMALEHLSRGENVLIATRNQEALEVIAEKVEQLTEDRDLIMHTGGGMYLRKLQQHLLRLTTSQTPVSQRGKKLPDLEADAKHVYKTLSKAERMYQTRVQQELRYGPWQQAPYPEDVSGFRAWWRKWGARRYARRIRKSPKLWKIAQVLEAQQANASRVRGLMLRARQAFKMESLKAEFPKLQPFLKALKASNLAESQAAYAQTDFNLVTQVFPIWLVNLNDVYQNLPMMKELFDVVIMDEATQCDITSALPVLQRGKRAVIVGDVNQLRHVSFLAGDRQRTLAEQLHLGYMDAPDYRNESILDLTLSRLASGHHGVMLQEHYRSHPSIIGFSNEHIYHHALQIMTQRPFPQPTEVRLVAAEGTRKSTGKNEREAELILERVKALIQEQRELPDEEVHSLGILSPFAAQADYLRMEVGKQIAISHIRRHQIQVGTPYAFQGAERDEMFLSFAVDPNTHPSVYPYLNRRDVFNVAITRARDRQWVFFSGDQTKLGKESLLNQYLEYVQYHEGQNQQANIEEDPFLDALIEEAHKRKWKCWPHFILAGIVVDVVIQTSKATFGVNLVGNPGPFQAALSVDEIGVLKRSGLAIFSLPYTLWVHQKKSCME
ncbi:MAG: DEAD/DEAH box helicase, partial [Bacteroidota bacterium]